VKADPKIVGLMLAESVEEEADLIRQLRDKYYALQKKLPFAGDDVRLWLCKGMTSSCMAWMAISNLEGWGIKNNEAFFKILGIDKSAWTATNIQIAVGNLKRTAKLGFNVDSQFLIEHSLKCLLRAIDPSDKVDTFKDVAEHILKACGIDEVQRKHDTLYVPALMRNCMHNGGIHDRAQYKIDLAGILYEFVKGEAVQCIRLEGIVHAMLQGADILEEIVLSKVSKKIAFIQEPFKLKKAQLLAKDAASTTLPT
jgi:hypothetical protein